MCKLNRQIPLVYALSILEKEKGLDHFCMCEIGTADNIFKTVAM